MRLIDADALNLDYEVETADDWKTAHEIANVIKYAPTVDAVQVRHGKWIVEDNPGTGWYLVECSECGENVTSTAPCIWFPPDAEVTWDYCPYCGAKMDKVKP